MNDQIMVPTPVGSGFPGHDPARSVPEPGPLAMVGLAILCVVLWISVQSKRITRMFKKRKLTPMPTWLKYGKE